MIKEDNPDNNKQISCAYGYQQLYWVNPIADNIKKIHGEIIKNTEIHYINEKALKEFLFEEFQAKKESIYFSLTISSSKNKYLVSGSEKNVINAMNLFGGNNNRSKLDKIQEDRQNEIKNWENIKTPNYIQELAMQSFECGDTPPENLLFFVLRHNVVMKIDFAQNKIFYKDSFGRIMPLEIKEFLTLKLPNYTIMEDTTVQQHPDDHCNCPIFATFNLQTLIEHSSAELPEYLHLSQEPNEYIEKIERIRSDISHILKSIHDKEENIPSCSKLNN